MHEIRVVAGKRFDDVSSPIVAAVPSSLFRWQHFHEDHQRLWQHAFHICRFSEEWYIHIKTEYIRKLSNFNSPWTKTLYQNNLNNIVFLFTFFKGYRFNNTKEISYESPRK